jgi:hypothetical protein
MTDEEMRYEILRAGARLNLDMAKYLHSPEAMERMRRATQWLQPRVGLLRPGEVQFTTIEHDPNEPRRGKLS